MFDDLDPAEFEATARAVVAACAGAEGTAARAALLAEAGLLGVCAPVEAGGLGLGPAFAAPIVGAAGAGLLALPLIEAIVLSRALATAAPGLAERICAGTAIVTVAWSGTAEEGHVGQAPMLAEAGHCLVFLQDGTALVTPTDALRIDLAEPGLDLELPAGRFASAGLASSALEGVRLDAATVAALRADATILRAAFALGSAQACLDLAVVHAQDRVQFGRPLSANQVLRHRMSRDALAIETMRNAIARALSEPAEGAEAAREAAWQGAAHYGPRIAESAIQVLGGMGFTWEVPLHRHLRQMLALNAQGGAAAGLAALAGRLMQAPENIWYEDMQDAV